MSFPDNVSDLNLKIPGTDCSNNGSWNPFGSFAKITEPRVLNRKLRFFKTTLITNPSLHQTKQFLCVILAKEPNGFQEPLLKQSVPGILRFRSETLSGSYIKNNYVHDSYLPH